MGDNALEKLVVRQESLLQLHRCRPRTRGPIDAANPVDVRVVAQLDARTWAVDIEQAHVLRHMASDAISSGRRLGHESVYRGTARKDAELDAERGRLARERLDDLTRARR